MQNTEYSGIHFVNVWGSTDFAEVIDSKKGVEFLLQFKDLGALRTENNEVEKEVKHRFNLRNA